ncbi:MAG: molybdenum cofactor biosynthesis protein MoaE [Thermomicrobiales bacterium]|nr:molybdenum cofactor biosynthesis protein MoaE [Thermomicrobiales bacterium]
MQVSIRYFAAIRETMGRASEERDVPDGTTAGALFDLLVSEQPRLAAMRDSTMLMVDRVYVKPDRVLRAGAEIALIPPVSGGAERRFRVQTEPLDPRQIEALVDDPTTGALVTFVGRVRDHARGQNVDALDYEAYPEAAEAMMAQIAEEIRACWGIGNLAIAHRAGLLRVGEASVVIAVASPHRGDAFAAAAYAIDRLKEIVPIWKKEHYADGSAWIGSEADYQRETGRWPTASEA